MDINLNIEEHNRFVDHLLLRGNNGEVINLTVLMVSKENIVKMKINGKISDNDFVS